MDVARSYVRMKLGRKKETDGGDQLHCPHLTIFWLRIIRQRRVLGSSRQGIIGFPQEHPRMEDIQGQHREGDHYAIEYNCSKTSG